MAKESRFSPTGVIKCAMNVFTMKSIRGEYQPAEILFGAHRRQVLGLLLVRPNESFHLREIGRLAGVTAGASHRELQALTDEKFLVRTPSGNQVRYP